MISNSQVLSISGKVFGPSTVKYSKHI